MSRMAMSKLRWLLLFLFTVWITWQVAEYHSQDPGGSYRTDTVPEYSFLASLHSFLVKQAFESTVSGGSSPAIAEEGMRFSRSVVETARPALNVYVYEMPAKFTTDLLYLFHDSLEQTANLTSNGSPVHRLIEQHSVDFWLFSDLMQREENRLVRSVRRVRTQAQADVFYIPFFTTIPFFLLPRAQSRLLYREAVKWITGQTAWRRSGGRDHVLAVHHPWSMKSHRRFLKPAIWLLPDLDSSGNWECAITKCHLERVQGTCQATECVLRRGREFLLHDLQLCFQIENNVNLLFSRYKEGEVSLERDVVMPYVANVEACDIDCLATSKLFRKTLLFFRGRLVRGSGGKIRAQLAACLRDEKEGIVIQEGSSGAEGKAATQDGMQRSVFCLSPAGDTPSSARLFDAILSGCIPVVVSDELELPFEGILDYQQVAVFVPAAQAVQKGWLVAHLRNKTSQEVATMQHQLALYARHFQYAAPAQPLGPEDLTWRMVAGKLQSVKLHIRRSQRLVQGALDSCTCQCTRANLSESAF